MNNLWPTERQRPASGNEQAHVTRLLDQLVAERLANLARLFNTYMVHISIVGRCLDLHQRSLSCRCGSMCLCGDVRSALTLRMPSVPIPHRSHVGAVGNYLRHEVRAQVDFIRTRSRRMRLTLDHSLGTFSRLVALSTLP